MEEKTNTPFPRHRAYYITLKFVILGLALALAIYIFGFLF